MSRDDDKEYRNNHYVPEWHQKAFLGSDEQLTYLDLDPPSILKPDGSPVLLPSGETKKHNSVWRTVPSRCFKQKDLYTTVFGSEVNVDVEKYLFGEIDTRGAKAVLGYTLGGDQNYHNYFRDFYEYISLQKLRTLKGLGWIRSKYSNLGQVDLMIEMQALSQINISIWMSGVREIVSASKSETKFIVTDHPVTVYNRAAGPDSELCQGFDDPEVALLGSQTVFPLSSEHCLILTNLEYAQNPNDVDCLRNRTNPRNHSQAMVHTLSMIRTRDLTENEVQKVNLVLKRRASRFIAATNRADLYPENSVVADWESLHQVLLPPKNQLYGFGREMYVGYEDGSTYYQDALGRTAKNSDHLRKESYQPLPDDFCSCGSGKKYKRCCMNANDRPTSELLSIRERTLTFVNGVESILGLNDGREWQEVQRTLSGENIKEIHELYGVLWPPDTHLADLLPKPNSEVTRLLYCGIVDPRVIQRNVVSLCLHFDEVLVVNPFANPEGRSPEYNPLESPDKFKQDTLRNVFLLMQLSPLVQAGYVTLIPDPCDFDYQLRRQMMLFAESRRSSISFSEEEQSQFEELMMDDFRRSWTGIPDDGLRVQIAKHFPDLKGEKLDEVLNYIKAERESDPLAILQDDVLRNGGQINTLVMSPNFELSLYLAQLTGAIPYTDVLIRWKELLSIATEQPLASRLERVAENRLPSLLNPIDVIRLRRIGVLSKFRRDLSSMLNDPSPDKFDPEMMGDLFRSAAPELRRRYDDFDNAIEMSLLPMIPREGLRDSGVDRLLLTYSFGNYLDKTLMALFLSN